jgi:hypothetical protein
MITAAKPTAAPKTRFTSLDLVKLGARLAVRWVDPLAAGA